MHAREKFDLVKQYGFQIDESKVIETLLNPSLLERKNTQYFAAKALDRNYALRVVYEKRKGYLVVVTFYPVRRERYGI